MSRGWRIALTVVALLVVVNLALRLLGTLTGGTPGGPRSSSYATSPQGDAAYADLLGHAGHPVEQVRSLPHRSLPDAGATVFLLDPPAVRTQDLQALRTFVRDGGRLVVSGLSREAVGELAPSASGRRARLQGIEIETRRLGRGSVLLLADSSPLQNRLLGDGEQRRVRSRARRRTQPAGRVPRELPRLRNGERALGSAALLEAAARGPRPGGARLHGRPWPALRPARGGGQEPRAAAPRVRRLARRGRRPEQAARRRGRPRAPRGPRRGSPPGRASAGRGSRRVPRPRPAGSDSRTRTPRR